MGRDVGVDALEMASRGFGFRESIACIVLIEEDLSLQVAGFYEVTVDEGEVPDAGTGEQTGGCGSGGPDADDSGVGGAEFGLPCVADAWKEDLTRIPFCGIDGWSGREFPLPRAGSCRTFHSGNGKRHGFEYRDGAVEWQSGRVRMRPT